jgi:hypothetical protein
MSLTVFAKQEREGILVLLLQMTNLRQSWNSVILQIKKFVTDRTLL